MPAALTTENLSIAASEALSWLTDHGFRYFKSFDHFRRKNDNGVAYSTINAVTHNRQNYHLAFYLGVRITEIEAWLHQIQGLSPKIGHYDRSIWNYTVNIGPGSPHWNSPICGTWTLRDLSEFSIVSSEVCDFIRDLALPFVTAHGDPITLRGTLVDQPGHAQNLYPYQQILAIDHLYGSFEQSEADIAMLAERYRRYAAEPRAQFHEFVRLFRTQTKNVEQGRWTE